MAASSNAASAAYEPTHRISFAKLREPLQPPNLLELQIRSFDWLCGTRSWSKYSQTALQQAVARGEEVDGESGLDEIFEETSGIEDARKEMLLEFREPTLEPPANSPEECRERDLTYSSKMYVKADFTYAETGEIKSQTVFMGDFPMMTEDGTFIINGTERVVVSQLVRSPGVYFERQSDPNSDRDTYGARIIPSRGAWLEFEIDRRDAVSVRIDRKRKLPVTLFLKAIGLTAPEIEVLFEDYPLLLETLAKDSVETREEALEEIYRKVRPGEPASVEAGDALLYNFYRDPKRYDMGKVGRYKINKKLGLDVPPKAKTLTEDDIVGTVKYMLAIQKGEKVLPGFRNGEPAEIRVETDDIDHFGNRRVRSVGELIQAQIRTGLSRMERTVRERMSTQDPKAITPTSLINIRPLTAAIKEFFGTSQLSQFMDQNNPLAGLTHKRRLSALGPGGLSRDRAGMEVRDVHPSHYGRMCPIETPEGPNIGLIGSLAAFARINPFGFIETPYRKVENGTVTNEVHWLTADEEIGQFIAQASAPTDANGHFADDLVLCRVAGEDPTLIERDEVTYMDVSARQMVSVATSLIPFLEHDDANRALMGANMQRQAVPLLTTEAPLVGTGMERRTAHDAMELETADKAGVVSYVSADEVVIANDDATQSRYTLAKFKRSNPGNCINQRVLVNEGDVVEPGDVIADGPSTDGGELALGKNLLVAYMSWEGLNYEDAIILSRRVVEDDVLTSIHIEEYEVDARETKLGVEEVTRDIPNISEEAMADLDERGIIRVGAEVRAGDILVGKVTPKGETELTSEERLLRAIFGEKAREVRDTSLRVPHGEEGIVIDVRELNEDDGDLGPGVKQSVRVLVAQRRKITIGDKMAGRHGNKGVVSKILPIEDMPFLADGTPVDIILNPMGVPGRMNVGQVLEFHLGWIAKQGWDATGAREAGEAWTQHLHADALKAPGNSRVATPSFDGLEAEELLGLLSVTNPNRDGEQLVNELGKAQLFDGRSGEPFPHPIAVGYKYMLKLHHLVDDKIHARSTGPYSMITQQPLGGKAQFGGQRFGEMEVWALEAYGAAYALQELLTIKSDDTSGRVKVYEAIVKGEDIPEPGIPESFRVLIQEMRSLCLAVEALDAEGNVLDLQETEEDMRAGEELGITLDARPLSASGSLDII
ncbi:DNA-directed RNA polymerase subunit beta [Actinomyces minihominis]|uniref:DNA-directed RNA polymerase subunit beta n=1 Tax=Actinomyces minihominis TaxID=2002838 RepID=UPI000C07543E|nr:DNA-directed RNA polymerase subunit beta [Actinomyces minihominis]